MADDAGVEVVAEPSPPPPPTPPPESAIEPSEDNGGITDPSSSPSPAPPATVTNGEKKDADAAASALNESITAQARREFERTLPENWSSHEAVPIIIKDLSVQKDADKKASSSSTSSLQQTPSVASAVLGRWLADKVGLGGRKPAPHGGGGDSSHGGGDDGDDDWNNNNIVSNVNALLLPGEGTLILSPSSSGKTTLLRSISDIVAGKGRDKAGPNYTGKVQVGHLEDPSESPRYLGRTTAFADQSDLTLTPILTVGETLAFSRMCTEASGTSGETKAEVERGLDAILKLTGLDHVKDTVVGDADIRGVSGGQKRRVKVLEMAVGSDVNAMFLDEITNGLDAASALSICKVLREALRAQNFVAMTSLLQPSTEVFGTFQRLLLLTSDGRVAYSGPTDGALRHFVDDLGLERPSTMNVPEFLLRCSSSPEDFWDSEKGSCPYSGGKGAGMAGAFRDSRAGKELEEEIEAVEREQADAAAEKRGGAEEEEEEEDVPRFAQPTSKQVSILIGRGWKLVQRNPASLMRVVSAIIFGAFIGTLFLNTPDDEDGTFTRAGYILTLLFISFLNSCMAPLEDLYHDRGTFYLHRRASFYSTVSYYLSQWICSLPVMLLEALFLSVISFFAVGMNNHGGWGFFYFWGMFSLVAMSGNAVSRVLAYSLPAPDFANNLGPAFLLLFVLGSCYSPQYMQLPAWLRWLAWLSPCAYCYEGVVVSEVMGRNVGDIDGTDYAALYLGIPRIRYSRAPAGMNTEGSLMGFDAYMIIVWALVFEVSACLLLHKSQDWYGPTTKRYQVSSGMSLRKPPSYKSVSLRLSRKDKGGTDDAMTDEEDEEAAEIPKAPPAHLTAKTIVYEVDVPIEEPAEKKKEEKADDEKAASTASSSGRASLFDDDSDESNDPPITALEYGQTGKGAAQEWVLKRRLGESALATSRGSSRGSSSAAASSAARESLQKPDELDPPEPGRLRLLSGITATFEPGTMTALMGSSGAGKSTLLDVLAGYKTGGYITGDVNINGKPKTDDTWRSIAGYCEQVDLHNPAMTVRESLIFAARMRLRPFALPDGAKVLFATDIISLLGLEDFADMLVGNEATGEGLPKHARKRLTVGVELAGNPSILFADEPTSGLDSLSASVVVSSLERAAKQQGLTVVCTIHQPSREVFEAFDNLLLLRKGGVCVYNGAITGLDAYMQSAPSRSDYEMPEGANPADHVLDVFCGPRGERQDWGQFYKRSDMARDAMSAFDSCGCESCAKGEISVDQTPQTFGSELWIVTQRQILAHWRTPTYMAVRIWWTIVANLLCGLVYMRAGAAEEESMESLQNIIGAIFFFVNIAAVPLLSAVVPLIMERAVYYREIASGTYRRQVYGVAVQIAEAPFNIGAGVLAFLIFYFLVGLSLEGERVAYFLLMALASYWLLPTLGQLLAFVSPNIGAAVGMGSLVMTIFTLTMGFLIKANDIPPWWIWIYWINPLRYILQGMVVNEVGGNPLGDAILGELTWSYDDRWFYCYFAVLMFGIAGVLGIVFATRISWLKR